MAKGGIVNPAAALGDATRLTELRQRLLFLAGALIVYRIGTFIPVPGIDPVALEQFSINWTKSSQHCFGVFVSIQEPLVMNNLSTLCSQGLWCCKY